MIDPTTLTGELLSQFQTDIYLKQLLRSKLSCLIGGIAILLASYIGIKQIKISKKQTDISNEQTKLADKQFKIASIRNKISGLNSEIAVGQSKIEHLTILIRDAELSGDTKSVNHLMKGFSILKESMDELIKGRNETFDIYNEEIQK